VAILSRRICVLVWAKAKVGSAASGIFHQRIGLNDFVDPAARHGVVGLVGGAAERELGCLPLLVGSLFFPGDVHQAQAFCCLIYRPFRILIGNVSSGDVQQAQVFCCPIYRRFRFLIGNVWVRALC
jgi:hypothetical protein